VNSVLSQNFPRHLYEILVVKNFRDEAIDSKLQGWGVVNLYSDHRGLGAKIVEALGIARGDVKSFLEDETSSCWASINAFTHPSRRKGRWTSITTESSSSTRPGGSCAWEATDH
jgi:hypothetical protein